MTREEAIEMLKSKMDGHTDTSYEWAETVRMAIKALEQKTVTEQIRETADDICNNYCQWPDVWDEEAEGCELSESDHCRECPLNRL